MLNAIGHEAQKRLQVAHLTVDAGLQQRLRAAEWARTSLDEFLRRDPGAGAGLQERDAGERPAGREQGAIQ